MREDHLNDPAPSNASSGLRAGSALEVIHAWIEAPVSTGTAIATATTSSWCLPSDAPKYEYCSPPLPPQGGFARAPPNPYHVSFAPVSMQDSEHHSLSSGAHTEENLSHIDGTCALLPLKTKAHLQQSAAVEVFEGAG
ncbi:unnamed protein product [Hydatigera taeniaeformis]|uniref:Uncharacterized protein n=1 Tax=Hydatigena taeniaeformis TaxID=6205 RepID=A0A0R3X2I8_HYDTA|nr:unnamed protein product [Hydatigera taeniaeformis]